MAIYGRFGGEVRIKRLATLEDVRLFEGRDPDEHDRRSIAIQGYVIVQFLDTQPLRDSEELYAVPYLRADDGFNEILDAVKAVSEPAAAGEVTP